MIEKKYSLFNSMLIFIILFAIIFTTFQVKKQENILLEGINNQLSNAAYTAAFIFGDKLHHDLPNNLSDQQNIKNALLLSSITKKSNVRYVYTLIVRGKEAYFTSSSVTDEEKRLTKYTPFMYKYIDATDSLKNSFFNHEIFFEKSTDEWGTFRSIIMPRKTENGKWYIVGADIEVSYVRKLLNNILIENIIAFSLFVIILLPFIYKYNNLLKEERRVELNKQKQLLEQTKLVQMGEMIVNISHQWRQPLSELNSVVMNIEIDFEENRLDRNTLEKRISRIENLTEHMSMTINDFNNFFKRDKIKELFYISEAVDQAFNICKNTCKQNGIEITIDIEKNIQIESYKNEFIQALIVIFQNAKDAMILNNIKKPKITITLKTFVNKIYLSILDNGGGIKDENINKIFEPYFTTKSKSNSTGIGLYMVKMIIEQSMNGEIFIANKDNGVEFKIVL